MKRYGIDARPLYSAASGIPLYTRRLIEHMGRHLNNDEEILLYLPTPINPYSNVWNLWNEVNATNWGSDQIKCKGSKLVLWLHALFETRMNLGVLAVDANHALNDVSIFHITNYEMPLLKRARRIVTIHDLAALKLPRLHNDLQIRKAGRYRRLCHEASAVICVSEATRRDVIELLGIEIEKTNVVYNACGNDCSRPDDHELFCISSKYRLPERYVLYLGTIEPRKNLVNLIRAFNLAVKLGDLSHHMVIAGRKGWLCDDIYKEAECSPFKERIHMIGSVPEKDVTALMSKADLFAFPSFMEGFGMPVLEAMNCAVPVLTSNTSSLPEVAGDAAVLVDPYNVHDISDAILRILKDKVLSDELRKRGTERAKQFSWDECAKQTLDVYRRLS